MPVAVKSVGPRRWNKTIFPATDNQERGTDNQLNPNYIISLQKVWGDGICWADVLSGNLEMFFCFCDDDDDFCDDDDDDFCDDD